MLPRNLVANTHAALNKLSRRRSVTNNLHRYRHRHQWMSVSTTLVTSSKTKSSFAAEELSSVGVKIYNLLDQGCLPYPKTWAYQLYLLNRRLEQKQRKCHQQQNFEEQKEPFVSPFYYDQDCVLILEHTSVYTLGRGADEAHLTFLNNYPEDDMKTSALQRLSKQSRGPGTARLTLDRRMEDQMKMMIKNSVYGSNSNKDETTVLRIIEKLTDSIFPVVAPNGVPVYRVERGGEGRSTFVVEIFFLLQIRCVLLYFIFKTSISNCSFLLPIYRNNDNSIKLMFHINHSHISRT